MKSLLLISLTLFTLCFSLSSTAAYERNKAVPVKQVLFGTVVSVRNISQEELIKDKNSGWKTFGGALIGGVIGNQFGGGSGRTIATVLGTVIGGNVANNNSQDKTVVINLVELMITIDCEEKQCQQFMVIQDYDPSMVFQPQDAVRMVYLTDDSVRIDKQY
ncbi:glycine zipper 2TM domain-containing protein [Colwellia sp. E2M01]|uniref:glycine zipper 2TM domain-containing protein n=1 Tax=Colwellia sp. E2M01 TaxID=2841561 RepID=UPI001C08FCB7|nr:glycine zipper 2TM domain-containing protein [Colwellia sp. E2M01]MBU2870825.1 glycine zipper 2TM domain-containing protein [Colwellia sp. E2M01]